jgi:hypothetical protein
MLWSVFVPDKDDVAEALRKVCNDICSQFERDRVIKVENTEIGEICSMHSYCDEYICLLWVSYKMFYLHYSATVIYSWGVWIHLTPLLQVQHINFL